MDQIAKELHVKSHSDWARIPLSTLLEYGASTLYVKYGSLTKMFSSIYPEYHERKKILIKNRSARIVHFDF